MNIGTDIDDTITYTTDIMIKYADKYNEEILGNDKLSYNIGNITDRHYLSNIYGWSKEIKGDFFNMYYKNIIRECQVIEDVANVLTKLKKEGNDIYFVTARMTNINGCDTEAITKEMLNINNIPYDGIIFNAKEKLEYADKFNIDIFVDDCFDICNTLEKNGIKTLLVTTEINNKIETNIERVNNWKQIYERINCYKNKGRKNEIK